MSSALISGALLLALPLGFGAYSLHRLLGSSAPPAPAPASWLQEGGEPAPAPAPAPRPSGQGRMPDLTLWDLSRRDVQLFDEGVAPAVVTEFLLGCPDCQPAFQLYPQLAARIRDAGEVSKNVAYMGERHLRQLEAYFQERDFAGPVYLDKGSQLQRRYGIGTFTVWLLDPDGTVRFQGNPAQASPLLDAHLERRRAARGGE